MAKKPIDPALMKQLNLMVAQSWREYLKALKGLYNLQLQKPPASKAVLKAAKDLVRDTLQAYRIAVKAVQTYLTP